MEIMSCFFQVATRQVIMTGKFSSKSRNYVISTAALLLDSTSSKDTNASSIITGLSFYLECMVYTKDSIIIANGAWRVKGTNGYYFVPCSVIHSTKQRRLVSSV